MINNVLITGGFGYVGSRLTPHLLNEGYSVTVLDLCLYGEYGYEALQKAPKYYEWSKRFKYINGDIRDPNTVEEAMKDIDAVIHLAAISNDPTGDIDEVLTKQVNFDAVGVLISMAKKCGVKRFINASSSSVFGIKEEKDITEKLEPEPITFYSKYKMLSEWIVRAASSEYFCTTSVRPATVCGYSPRQRFDLTVNKLTADAVHKGLITVHGGQQRRPNVGMNDMINIYSHLLKAKKEQINGKTFNFGFENHKVIEIAELIKQQLSHLDVKIEVTKVYDQRDYHISSEKILKELDYGPVSSISREVEELQEALKTQYKCINDKRFYNMQSMQLERNGSAYNI
ncbi:MAG: SDR family oxidoreductase [Bacteriovoracaceae bacterium]|nr:SDR family oxidoreductase [Bacteriovoracaceae bacterium]